MPKKIIVLNAGLRTRKAFTAGLGNTPMEHYKSKEMMIHISKDLSVQFISKNNVIDFKDSYVFTRLRATDPHLCGILYEHLASIGVPASDPINTSFKMSEEKISQMTRLARARIMIPETIIAREESFMVNKDYILQNIHFPLVYKTDGSQGRSVFKINSLQELEEHISKKKKYELFLLQELIPNTFDSRTLIAYGTVLGSIKRIAQNGSFHNNVAQGARVERYELTQEEKEIALRVCSVNKIDFGGVDIIHTDQGPIVLEVNKSPQIKGFERIHGENIVFKTIAEMLCNN